MFSDQSLVLENSWVTLTTLERLCLKFVSYCLLFTPNASLSGHPFSVKLGTGSTVGLEGMAIDNMIFHFGG